ncbi:conserved hypothetical protein [Lodderomyces elongisporus NRRL YB-4239]|uniref:Reverse transcriptase Ty1/copia-type domain-containing protein n=1 Tax=Lodderomyces elongisporus (strain ATCC 11503 / CBS 2605 / JCM 1781 / NBRC 1676 / NRRL YB-4239) TaxID=379508 RepID=A5DZY3_LODEL|nr:conserved hypothetical protein [Lodderomyces elongisporus NRRL YB-4239]
MEVKLSLHDYIDKMLSEFGMEDCKLEPTPASATIDLTPLDHIHDDNENTSVPDRESRTCDFGRPSDYRSLVGKLLFAANTVRYDISHIVGVLSRYLQAPKEIHWKAAKRVLRYLHGTKDFGIKYRHIPGSTVEGYSDADWGSDTSTRKSTTGLIFRYAGGPITWKSKKQATVAQSSSEAEYVALSESCKEALWLINLLGEFNVNVKGLVIHEYNKGAIDMANHPTQHHKSKHIDLKVHFKRDHISKGEIKVQYLRTEDQLADMLTKNLPRNQFERLRDLCENKE